MQDASKEGIVLIPFDDLKKISIKEGTSEIGDVEIEQKESALATPDNTQINNQHDDVDDSVNLKELNLKDNQKTLLDTKPSYKKGTEIKFNSLILSEKIGTLKVQTIFLVIECVRCKQRMDMKLLEKK